MHLRPPSREEMALGTESETARRMAEAAVNFLASLTPGQKGRVVFPAASQERMNWHYIPRQRQGLSFKEMDGSQRKLAHALLSSGLSRDGYAKAMTIMSLEAVLKQLEGPARRFERDPDLYSVSLFGTPSTGSPWGWRVEGHHLSVNLLVVDGKWIAPTPNFFGANPAHVPAGNRLSGLRVLAAEEDLARSLLTSLGGPERTRTIVDPEAPPDILTQAERHIKWETPVGVPASEMTEDQQQALMDLVSEYTSRMPPDVAYTRMDRIEKEGISQIHFAWAGSEKPGAPHYYRLHGPSFLIEYDNTQNKANHIHTVWRDLKDDWGDDLLQRHYGTSHSLHEG